MRSYVQFRMPSVPVEPLQVLPGEGAGVEQGGHHHERPGPEPRLVEADPQLAHGEHPRQYRELLAAHPLPPVAVPVPLDDVVLAAQLLAPAEVGPAVPGLPHHHVDPHPRQRHHRVERAVVGVGQQDVPRLSRPWRVRSRACSPVRFPLPPPTAASSTHPVARDSRTTIRAIGNPHPGFWATCWGYSAWFSGVSGMLTVEPSAITTLRPWNSQPSGAPSWSRSAVSRANRGSSDSGSRCRALQYPPVSGEHGGQPPGGPPGHQPGDGGEAGLVVAEGLGEEDGEGDQGGVDPVAGLAGLPGDGRGDVLGGEDVAEDQAGVDDEGAEQGAELCGGPPGIGSDTVGPPCRRSKVVRYPRLEAGRAYLVHPLFTKRVAAPSVPFKYEQLLTSGAMSDSRDRVCRTCFGVLLAVGIGFLLLGVTVVPLAPHFQPMSCSRPRNCWTRTNRGHMDLLKKAAGNQWRFWTAGGLVIIVVTTSAYGRRSG